MTTVRTPPFTPAPPRRKDRSGYTVAEIAEGASGGLDAVAVGAAALPGFLLTVPGLLLFLAPVIALGVVMAAVAVVLVLVAIPLVVAALVTRRAWRARHGLRMPSIPTITRRPRPTTRRAAL